MSAEEEVGGGAYAERKFWRSPELVEKLLSHLDLPSIQQLAWSHKLTRQIIGKEFTWNRLVKKIFPKDPNINGYTWYPDTWYPCWDNWPEEGDPLLASEMSKAKILGALLSLAEDSDKSQLQMVLFHTICERHAFVDPNPQRLIDVGCSCLETHTLSVWGFLLLREVQAGSILVVERVKGPLCSLLLTALGSLVVDQQGEVKTLDVNYLRCHNKQSAEVIAALVERSQTMLQHPRRLVQGDWEVGTIQCPKIYIVDEIGAEGWAAIRRAVEHLLAASGKVATLDSERKAMIAGRREDLKAIWNIVPYWVVRSESESPPLGFPRFRFDGAEWVGWAKWERLQTVIDMTDEEWLEELRPFQDQDSESDGEEEGEVPAGP